MKTKSVAKGETVQALRDVSSVLGLFLNGAITPSAKGLGALRVVQMASLKVLDKVQAEEEAVEWRLVKSSVSGIPRYACHFISLLSDNRPRYPGALESLDRLYEEVLLKFRGLGGRRFLGSSNREVVFKTSNLEELERDIQAVRKSWV